MSSVASDIFAQLQKSVSGNKSPAVNPLVTIGLAPAVLDLGMSDDELFDYCMGMSKLLARHHHPDRQLDHEVSETQKRVFEAFNLLKQRSEFDRALAEFRSLKAEERAELNHVRRLHAELTNRVGSDSLIASQALQEKLEAVEREGLFRDRLQYLLSFQARSFRKEHVRHPSRDSRKLVESCSIDRCRRLKVLTFTYAPNLYPREKAKPVLFLGLEASWIETQMKRSDLKPPVSSRVFLEDAVVKGLAQAAGVEGEVESIRKLVLQANRSPTVFRYQEFTVRHGCMLESDASNQKGGYRVLGSLFSGTLVPADFDIPSRLSIRPDVFAKRFQPFLSRGAILVQAPFDYRQPRVSDARMHHERLFDEWSTKRPLLFGRHLILEIE